MSALPSVGHNSMAQSVFRAHGERGYTKLRNEFLQDKRISDETRGLVARLLSRPVDWHFTVKEIIASGPSGRDKVYRMLREAEMYGYVMPENPRRENGTFTAHVYLVTDDPAILIQRTASEIFDIQNATSGKSVSGHKPLTGNPDTARAEVDSFEPLPENPDTAQPDTAQPDTVNPHQTNKRDIQTTHRTNDISSPAEAPVRDGSALDFMLNHYEHQKPEPEYASDFEEWWKVYPRKTGKGASAKIWSKMTAAQRKRALSGLRIHLGGLVERSLDQRGNFCPHPETWLRQGRYDDDPPQQAARGSKQALAPPGNWYDAKRLDAEDTTDVIKKLTQQVRGQGNES